MNRVPKIRFKEFSGEWEEKKIEEIADKKIKWSFTGGPFGSDLKSEHYTENGIRIIQLQNIGDGKFLDNYKIYTSIEKANQLLSCNIYPNEILMSKMGDPVARACIIPNTEKRYLMSSDGIRLVPDKEFYNNIFIYEKINDTRFREKALTNSTGSTRKRIGLNQLKELSMLIPSLPEQEKIADFLLNVDIKIEKLERKKELWEQYKKGMMQKIFSQEIRFKDEFGNEYPEWEYKFLKEFGKLQGGYAFKSELFQKKGIPIIRISNISNRNQYIDLSNLVYYNEIFNDENFTIKKGELIIAMSGATTGKLSVYNLEQKAYLNQRVGLFKILKDNINYNYIIQFCLSTEFSNQLGSVLVAGAQPNISSKDLENFTFKIPSLPEQEKIANVLSSIDSKIEIVEKELEGMKEFKKGLLQEMFV